MLGKTTPIIAVFSLIIMATGGSAAAHELEASGNISAVLHVEPNDIVTVGKPAVYDLEFKDKTGAFKLIDCDCQLVVHRNEKTVSTGTFKIANSTAATGSITAPTAGGEYEVAVSGTPKTAGAFEAFDLEFPIKVRQPATSKVVPIVVVIAVVIIGLGAGLWVVLRRRPKTTD